MTLALPTVVSHEETRSVPPPAPSAEAQTLEALGAVDGQVFIDHPSRPPTAVKGPTPSRLRTSRASGPAGPRRLRAASEALVGGEDLVNPATEHGDTGIDGRSAGGAGAASPGDDSNQSPGTTLLTDQRATGITLREHKAIKKRRNNSHISPRRGRRKHSDRGTCASRDRRALTIQEVAPAPPAQIISSEMLLPQCLLHWSLDSRGRAACCSLLGVLGAEGNSQRHALYCESSVGPTKSVS